MSNTDYNRYGVLSNVDNVIIPPPFIKLPLNLSDKYENWKLGYSRFDKLARKYYGNPFYDIFILCANPEYVNEFDIEEGTLIRIPFPLSKVKSDYESIMSQYVGR